GGGRAPFRRHRLGDLRFLRWRSHQAGGRLGGRGLGLGLVHRLARGRGGLATPVQLVLWLPGPSRVPALATIDDAVGPVVAVAGDALWLALDAVAAAREVNQRARNQHYDESPDWRRSAPPHAVQTRRGAGPNWGGHRLLALARALDRGDRHRGERRLRAWCYAHLARGRHADAPGQSVQTAAVREGERGPGKERSARCAYGRVVRRHHADASSAAHPVGSRTSG